MTAQELSPSSQTIVAPAVTEPDATPEEMAAVEFEAWRGVPMPGIIHTEREWADLGELHLPTASAAYVMMFKTKPQLIELVANTPEEFMDLLDRVTELHNSLGAYVSLLANAQGRLLIALSATSLASDVDVQKPEAG